MSDARPTRRYRIVRNPAAGSKGGIPTNGVGPRELADLAARHGLGSDIVEADGEAAVQTAVRDAIAAGVDVVIAAGGDGTAGSVARQLLDGAAALAVLPLGSVMNIARALGIPRDLEAAAELIPDGELRTIDTGEAESADGRRIPFLEAGSVGMNAAMFREAARFEEGDWASIVRTIWVALRYRPARMRIELDDRRVRTRALMVTASIGPYTGAGMTVAPEARLDDGRFDVRVFRGFSKWELIRHLASIAFGRRRYAPHVSTYRSATVRISSARPLPARADGKDLGATPVTFRTRAASLRVIVPRSDERNADAAVGPAS
ncbi:MAG TPA: diacylglycerol kinase family protein [Candidatus Limnocylindrales bacterium]|nr:diacylglycerol kinase family protein [Candidatus Limnocylindrales bacterium]